MRKTLATAVLAGALLTAGTAPASASAAAPALPEVTVGPASSWQDFAVGRIEVSPNTYDQLFTSCGYFNTLANSTLYPAEFRVSPGGEKIEDFTLGQSHFGAYPARVGPTVDGFTFLSREDPQVKLADSPTEPMRFWAGWIETEYLTGHHSKHGAEIIEGEAAATGVICEPIAAGIQPEPEPEPVITGTPSAEPVVVQEPPAPVVQPAPDEGAAEPDGSSIIPLAAGGIIAAGLASLAFWDRAKRKKNHNEGNGDV